MQNLAAIDVV